MQKKFLLRISPQLWDELEKWAKDELRSVNGQIEYLLRDAVACRRRALPPALSTEAEQEPEPDDQPADER